MKMDGLKTTTGAATRSAVVPSLTNEMGAGVGAASAAVLVVFADTFVEAVDFASAADLVVAAVIFTGVAVMTGVTVTTLSFGGGSSTGSFSTSKGRSIGLFQLGAGV